LICDQSVWQQQMDALSEVTACTCADYGTLDSLTAMAEAVLRIAPERFSLAGHSMADASRSKSFGWRRSG
jgi:hypothetical protein